MPKPCFVGIDRFLKEKYGQVNQTTLAGYINESQPAYSNSLNGTSNLNSKAVYKYVKKIYELGIVEERKQNAENLFNALEDIHGSGCAKNLLNGNSNASKASSLSNYKNGKATISKKQYQNLFGKHSSKIFNPIIEFMECAPQKKDKHGNCLGTISLKRTYKKNCRMRYLLR